MPYGNNTPLIGEGVQAALGLVDYSGYSRAAEQNANRISDFGTSVAGQINDYAKEQKEAKNALKAGQVQIEAAMKLFPDQADYLGQIANELKNEDTPLSARAEISKQTADYISMAVGQKRYETDQHYKEKELSFRERDQNMQERESTLRQHVTGMQITDAENSAELDTATKAAAGPVLAQYVKSALPPELAKSVNFDGMTPEQQFSTATTLSKLIPDTDQQELQLVDIPQGDGSSKKMNFNKRTGTLSPIQVGGGGDSPDLIPFVAALEGFKSTPHSDSGQTSIGFGTRAKPGDKQITEEEGAKRLKEELAASAERIQNAVAATGAQLNPNQIKSLVSFDFNTGQGQSVVSRFAKDPAAMAAKMAEYQHADASKGDKLLVGRRNKEIALFNTPAATVGTTPAVTPEQAAAAKIAQEKHGLEVAATQEKKASTVAKSQELINRLGDLEKHPGFNNLFGTNVGVPTWVAGSSGADANTIFKQIEGKGFIEAIQDMKGMGALSNAEGEKASAAFLGLSPKMSEAAAKARIKEIKELVAAGIARTAAGALVNPDGSPKPPPQITRESASGRLGQMNSGGQ